ncbi:MAG: cupin domain-containing protein, partial [Gemmatimonadales bacterium]|nr:cupin domain-containing protein [Gemmatimonadales bacterium]
MDRSDADTTAGTAAAAAGDTTGDALNWGPAPAAFRAGARAAVLEGDPAKPGPFTIRLDLPDGYEVRPHHHPMSERVRVLEGTALLGRGKRWDDNELKP